MKLSAVKAATISLVLSVSTSANAMAVLYDNGLNFSSAALEINNFSIANSFFIDRKSEISGLRIGLAHNEGDVPISLKWNITSSYLGFPVGTVSSLNLGPILQSIETTSGKVIYRNAFVNFSIPVLFQGSGFLILQGAKSEFNISSGNTSSSVYWWTSYGPSVAFHDYLGPLFDREGNGLWESGSFSILGNAVPEPTNWAMLISGFGLIGASMRIRRQRCSRSEMPNWTRKAG